MHRGYNCIRAYRKQAELSQRDLAHLIGYNSRMSVFRLEREGHLPTVDTVIACQIIFGASTQELFPDLYQEIEQITKERARELLKEFIPSPEEIARKRRSLEELIERKSSGPRSHA